MQDQEVDDIEIPDYGGDPEQQLEEQQEPEQPIEQPLELLQQMNPEEVEDSALVATAIPDTDATGFIQAEGAEDVTAQAERRELEEDEIAEIAAQANRVATFIKLVNEGNLIQMKISLQTGTAPELQPLVNAVVAASEDYQFHAFRAQILQPLVKVRTPAEIQDLMGRSKQVILGQTGVPNGVTSADLSWDAFSFKTPPCGFEYLCQRVPEIHQKLTMEQMYTLKKVEDMMESAIIEKCREYRTRSNTVPDEFTDDLTVYLENQVAGAYDDDRQLRISKVGRNTLILYIKAMASLFLTGNLPASVQPAKIYLCHDIASAPQLRTSIQKMAEVQIAQGDQIVSSRLVNMGMMQNAQGDESWTQKQAAMINMRKAIDVFGRRAAYSMGDDYDRPMKNLEHQLAGSSNTMKTQVEVATGDYAIHQTEEQMEISRQQLSILLACLRMRANAIMESDSELMTDDDLDHLEVVKYLARQLPEIGNGNDGVFGLATTIQEAFQRGHNMMKLKGKDLPAELYDLVHYTIRGRLKNVLRSIPVFDEDSKTGGSLTNMAIQCNLLAIAQKNRIYQEMKELLARKL